MSNFYICKTLFFSAHYHGLLILLCIFSFVYLMLQSWNCSCGTHTRKMSLVSEVFPDSSKFIREVTILATIHSIVPYLIGGFFVVVVKTTHILNKTSYFIQYCLLPLFYQRTPCKCILKISL